MTVSTASRFSYPNPKGTRRAFVAASAGGLLTVSAAGAFRTAAAQDTGYQPGEAINSTTATFAGGTYTAYANDTLYQYAHDDNGDAYYNTYDGSAWSGWETYEEQPAPVGWDPAPVVYDDASYVYYTGDDGYLYQQSWDSYGDPAWEDVSGDYTYAAAPYATSWEDNIYLYATADDGNVYHKGYNEADGWGTWTAVNDAAVPAKTDAKPYSVSWADHENVFWLGENEKVYWNRYNYADGEWAGAREIPADYTFKCVPYAVGYAPETALYAFSANADGGPVYNKFVDGDGWSGWEPWETEWTAKYQANAYVYDDWLHLVYTADDDHAYHTYYSADGWSGEWEDLGDNYGYDSYQYEYEDSLYLTYTGADGSIYWRPYADGGGSVEPTEEPDY